MNDLSSPPVTRGERARVLWAFLGIAAVLGITVWQSSEHLGRAEEGTKPRFTTLRHGDAVLGPWLYWDSVYFGAIAEHGYTDADVTVYRERGQSTVAFFPLYPAVSRGLAEVLGDTGLAMVLVTFVCGIALAQVLFGWFRMAVGPAAGWALAALLLYPWSYVFIAAGYSDALFLLLVVGAFLLVERDRPALAGLAGALAALTRLAGAGVLIGLVVVVAERRGALSFDGWRPRLDRSKLRARDGGVLLAGTGLLAWMGFCWARYGSPLAFSTAERGWSQGFGPRSWFKLGLIEQVVHNSDTFFLMRLVAQGVAITLLAATIPTVWRRLGAGYGTYTAIVLALPLLGSANFASNGRFALAAFPCWAVIGERLAVSSPRTAQLALASSGLLLVGVASCWGRGYWMS